MRAHVVRREAPLPLAHSAQEAAAAARDDAAGGPSPQLQQEQQPWLGEVVQAVVERGRALQVRGGLPRLLLWA